MHVAESSLIVPHCISLFTISFSYFLMLTVISPAKTLDFGDHNCPAKSTTPDFLTDSRALVKQLRELAPEDIGQLMGISEKLSQLNHDRFHSWKTPFTEANAKPALLAFKGDVYTDIETGEYTKEDFAFAQAHLRILSGLYGILRPLDLMQAYRLEMGTKLDTKRGTNLYQFWGTKITTALNNAMAEAKTDTLVNLASNEYFSSVVPAQLEGQIITPVFKDTKNGKQKIISFYAKRARGMMANHIIRKQLTDPKALKRFKVAGYTFDKDQSDASTYTFTREEQ